MSWTPVLLFAGCVLVVGTGAILAESEVRLPGDHKHYEPDQPIAFSHRVHAGELQMDCRACHYAAEDGRHAGVPNAELCMGCHKHVTSTLDARQTEDLAAEQEGREPRRVVSPELRKLYDALALDEDLQPIPGAEPRPIEWVRVHELPDHAYFDHRVHVSHGLACQQCHGPVQSMERIRQHSDLSMGWCIQCHRESKPRLEPEAQHVSTDCARCHY